MNPFFCEFAKVASLLIFLVSVFVISSGLMAEEPNGLPGCAKYWSEADAAYKCPGPAGICAVVTEQCKKKSSPATWWCECQ